MHNGGDVEPPSISAPGGHSGKREKAFESLLEKIPKFFAKYFAKVNIEVIKVIKNQV